MPFIRFYYVSHLAPIANTQRFSAIVGKYFGEAAVGNLNLVQIPVGNNPILNFDPKKDAPNQTSALMDVRAKRKADRTPEKMQSFANEMNSFLKENGFQGSRVRIELFDDEHYFASSN
eukprot:GEZU01013664.1.p1 GENE.GEZU01013664.1~~GEZU01013664.1.p1  ORF type:complete len:129 (-),score=17.37 GEZU01013664.1:97-450(-)